MYVTRVTTLYVSIYVTDERVRLNNNVLYGTIQTSP